MAIFKEFRARFIGKGSPVHFFWGSFDLAVSRFSGRRAPERPGADRITREAYSHEVSSAGFWPGGGAVPDAAFYSYFVPEPAGFSETPVRPEKAFYTPQLHEFVLMYEDVRASEAPKETLLDFFQSTYEAGANLANWDRQSLERRKRCAWLREAQGEIGDGLDPGRYVRKTSLPGPTSQSRLKAVPVPGPLGTRDRRICSKGCSHPDSRNGRLWPRRAMSRHARRAGFPRPRRACW